MKHFINPQLCEITEDLVYTEPYNDLKKRNHVFGPNEEFVREQLYEDEKLHLVVAQQKFAFMNHAQALIHGDLHTGSIFVTPESTYVFDPEFVFYGPIGYDVGNIIANLIFAWCNADALGDRDFAGWLEKSVEELVDQFREKFLVRFEQTVTDPMAKTPGFALWYLEQVLKDTAAVTGLELNRRTVGMANVVDLTSIKDAAARARAERICILLGKKCLMSQELFTSGSAYREALYEVLADDRINCTDMG